MDCCKDKQNILHRMRSWFKKSKSESYSENLITKKVALIGNPNVGKSVIFNSLTGAYVTVSNYPGTTVEVSRGWYMKDGIKLEVVDTPGMYSILPITDEERVTRNLLIEENPDLVIHVVDAKNLERMLPLTIQLIEAGFKLILVLNIMDEAKTLGIEIDAIKLESLLGIPVVSASAALNVGINEMKKVLEEQVKNVA